MLLRVVVALRSSREASCHLLMPAPRLQQDLGCACLGCLYLDRQKALTVSLPEDSFNKVRHCILLLLRRKWEWFQGLTHTFPYQV